MNLPPTLLNRIYCQSSENLQNLLPDESVHLAVTSPPYNVGKVYEEPLALSVYRTFLGQVFREVYRVLVPGGRLCVNIANTGRKPYIPLAAHLTEDLLLQGYQMRGEIIWDKGASVGTSTAWGSWASASNPVLRDVHEYILVFCKGGYSRKKEDKHNSLNPKQYPELTRSVWRFPTASAKQIGHPCPFPVELPKRCMELYSFVGEVVLDPFMGSGQTALAALHTGRAFLGVEKDPAYVALAERRIEEAREALKKVGKGD